MTQKPKKKKKKLLIPGELGTTPAGPNKKPRQGAASKKKEKRGKKPKKARSCTNRIKAVAVTRPPKT